MIGDGVGLDGATRGVSRTRHRSVPEHKTSFEKARGMKQFTTGLRVSFGCTSQRFAAVGGHPRHSVEQGASRESSQDSGINTGDGETA